MPSASAPLPEPNPTSPLLRESGLDFDREASKSTLHELIQMGGLFPLAKVADRLPFPLSTLRGWARRGPFTSCFTNVRPGGGAKATLILVDLSHFSDRFEAVIQQSREDELRRDAALFGLLLGKSGHVVV